MLDVGHMYRMTKVNGERVMYECRSLCESPTTRLLFLGVLANDAITPQGPQGAQKHHVTFIQQYSWQCM